MFLRLIRALDGILAGIAFLMTLTMLPALSRQVISPFHSFYLLAGAWIAWCACRLPLEFHNLPDWRKHVVQLRWSALAAVGLSPFIRWWLHAPGNLYLFLNAFACAVCIIAAIFQLNFLVLKLARFAGHGGLEIEARMARHATLYLSLVCMLTVILVATVIGGRSVGMDTYLLVRSLPLPVLYLPLLPVILCMTLIARIRQPLEEMFHAVVQDRL